MHGGKIASPRGKGCLESCRVQLRYTGANIRRGLFKMRPDSFFRVQVVLCYFWIKCWTKKRMDRSVQHWTIWFSWAGMSRFAVLQNTRPCSRNMDSVRSFQLLCKTGVTTIWYLQGKKGNNTKSLETGRLILTHRCCFWKVYFCLFVVL